MHMKPNLPMISATVEEQGRCDIWLDHGKSAVRLFSEQGQLCYGHGAI